MNRPIAFCDRLGTVFDRTVADAWQPGRGMPARFNGTFKERVAAGRGGRNANSGAWDVRTGCYHGTLGSGKFATVSERPNGVKEA